MTETRLIRALLAVVAVLALACLSATAARAETPEHFAHCSAPKTHPTGFSRAQYYGPQLEAAMRASAARPDYAGMAFAGKQRHLEFFVLSRKHDRAIYECARTLGIAQFLKIEVHRWTMGQIAHALDRVETKFESLYDNGILDGDYGASDHFNLVVYRQATAAQFAQIKAAAKATGVGFTIRRVDSDPPVGELQ